MKNLGKGIEMKMIKRVNTMTTKLLSFVVKNAIIYCDICSSKCTKVKKQLLSTTLLRLKKWLAT